MKFENQGTQLTGSFRKPEPGRKGGGPYPAVAFVDGSGPAERDGWDDEAEVDGHRLTEEGARLRAAGQDLVDEVVAVSFQHLSAAQVDQLGELLTIALGADAAG